ncbi:hypothetical protein SASPL_132146 [Salvia splendens]|uniref:Protein kinase domain-containing protein n=1 Tax=Salvia splendens TaxID=180675 RepID=A0A8X8XAC4_SALSN|nr:hypothetical protein SASPL_132146 [Salvia splendens]
MTNGARASSTVTYSPIRSNSASNARVIGYPALSPHNASTTAYNASTAAYNATEVILLSCGASTITNDTSLRSWDSDQGSKYVSSNAPISSASEALTMEPWVPAVPYKTARVFQSPFTYNFPLSRGQKFLSRGQKFLRLYLYPSVYSDTNTSQSFFSVNANDFTLFTNFSASLYSESLKRPFFMVEFIVSVGATQRLLLTFTPNPNSSAFVNGIEIVSMPDKLYLDEEDVPIKYGEGLFNLNSNTALESLYRLNVGGDTVEIQEGGMFRGWSPDDGNLILADSAFALRDNGSVIKYTNSTPPYTAPQVVYLSGRTTHNISQGVLWGFPVDSGFFYLLRFHFYEFVYTKKNERNFTMTINDDEFLDVDIVSLAGGPDIPIFTDCITWIPDVGNRGKAELGLLMVSSHERPLLNGLEIFKLNDTTGSLAASIPQPVTDSPPTKAPKKKNAAVVIYSVVGSVIGVVVVVAAVTFLILRRQRKSTRGSLRCDTCRYLSIGEIRTATRNFDESFIIGRGGYGNVYRGLIDNAATTVAIKRLSSNSNQGAHEFLTEIDMLSKLRHLHLVSLIGYCDDNGEMILVYDYMARGTLRDHICNPDNSPLMWKQRLQICLGAAKGLDYLHTGTKHAIIHRDVKSTNILLDGKWVAKISDFGLSKMGPENQSFTHISTNVKGTFGYLDPKYYTTGKLTSKSDVYAFGVVLFEVISGRAAVDTRLEEEQHSLAGWARYCIQEGKLDQLIDQSLMGQISAACLEAFVGIGGRCLHLQPQERPAMGDVVKGLELAMALQ